MEGKQGGEIFVITAAHPSWPILFKEMPDPPSQLFCRGNPAALTKKFLSVVGARRATAYGLRAVKELVMPLVPQLGIASGMAFGIDAAAHQAALHADGTTVAVLGCGLDDASIYPCAHIGLAKKILAANGCLISEYPPGTKARAGYFPIRNRLLAGLAPATLVVEAAMNSGTMITAHLALGYNRDVLAIPGSIFALSSHGTNSLLKNGARLISSVNDILEAYNLAPKQLTLPTPTVDEQTILDLLSGEPVAFDALNSHLHWENQRLATAILLLEISGRVRKLPGQGFIS